MSRGTQAVPQAVTRTGYEMDSIGGINFGGFDGSAYYNGAVGLYTQISSNWTPTNHGACLSVYGTDVGQITQNQLVQFGGPDANDIGDRNIIFYRPLTFFGNATQYPGLFPAARLTLSDEPKVAFRCADNSADASITAGNAILSGSLTANDVNAVGNINVSQGTIGGTISVGNAPGVGYVTMRGGDVGDSGYFEWFNHSHNRLAYLGYSDTQLELWLENSANFKITGGDVTLQTGQLTFGGNGDISISRLGPMSLAIGNGTSRDTSGSLTLAQLVLSAPQSPASTAVGIAGELAYDSNYIYVCQNSGNWTRASLVGGY